MRAFVVLLLFLTVSAYAQEVTSSTIAYSYDVAGNRVTTISTPGNNGSRFASLVGSPPCGQNVESAVTKSRKEDVSSGDDPQRIVGDIADERKSLHQSSKKNKRDY